MLVSLHWKDWCHLFARVARTAVDTCCRKPLKCRAQVYVYACYRSPFSTRSGRYGQEFRQLLARDPNDMGKYKDHETLLSFYTEDVMRAAEREVCAMIRNLNGESITREDRGNLL